MYSIDQITVLGSGIMGHGIAQVSAMAGYKVILRDIEQSFLDKAMGKITWSLNKLTEKQKITESEANNILSRITPIVDIQKAIKNSDLVIEAVPEDLNLKKKVYDELEKYSNEDIVYASNTSTLPISEMSAFTNRPNKFIGIHFFNPPQLMKLVEVIPGNKTDDEIVNLTIDYVKKVKKIPILCKKDVAGFIVNRIFIPLVHEAAHCLDRYNSSLVEVDSSSKYRMHLPMGIFELADYTGMDVIHKATNEMYSRDKKVINPNHKIQELYENKCLGQKSGKGFYEYKQDNYERIELSKDLAAKFDPSPLIAIAANNASWLISHNVCTQDNLEQALQLGMGFKQELFKTVNDIGIKNIISTLNELKTKYGDFYEPDEYLVKLNTS